MNVERETLAWGRAMTEDIAANIATLQEKIAAAGCVEERKHLRQVLPLDREMLTWCKTRAGY